MCNSEPSGKLVAFLFLLFKNLESLVFTGFSKSGLSVVNETKQKATSDGTPLNEFVFGRMRRNANTQ